MFGRRATTCTSFLTVEFQAQWAPMLSVDAQTASRIYTSRMSTDFKPTVIPSEVAASLREAAMESKDLLLVRAKINIERHSHDIAWVVRIPRSAIADPNASGSAIHPRHFVIVLCQSEYPRLRRFQCLVKPSPQNRPPVSSNRECGWITARPTASPTFSTKH